jgi:hypothetical protein
MVGDLLFCGTFGHIHHDVYKDILEDATVQDKINLLDRITRKLVRRTFLNPKYGLVASLEAWSHSTSSVRG